MRKKVIWFEADRRGMVKDKGLIPFSLREEIYPRSINETALYICDGKIKVEFNDIQKLEKFSKVIIQSYKPYEKFTIALSFALYSKGLRIIDNSILTENYQDNKMRDYVQLASKGIKVPNMLMTHNINLIHKFFILYSKIIVKPNDGKAGQEVEVLNSVQAIDNYFLNRKLDNYIVQEFIESEFDYRTYVIHGKCLPFLLKRRTSTSSSVYNDINTFKIFKDEISKYPKIKDVSLKSVEINGVDVAALDIRIHNGEPIVIEVNRRPNIETYKDYVDDSIYFEILKII